MYKYIKRAAESFEQSAPKECVLGAKIATLGVVTAFVGLALIFSFSDTIGSVLAYLGTLVSLVGMFIITVCFFKKLTKEYKEGKAIKQQYENPKRPWE